jgi:hypothetical protein
MYKGNMILDSSGEPHSYREFIEGIMTTRDIHNIQWDDKAATIELGGGFTLTCSFSYNEPKIYFNLAGHSFRILDNGYLAVNCVKQIQAQMKAIRETIGLFEG